jgi:hypothetical protein
MLTSWLCYAIGRGAAFLRSFHEGLTLTVIYSACYGNILQASKASLKPFSIEFKIAEFSESGPVGDSGSCRNLASTTQVGPPGILWAPICSASALLARPKTYTATLQAKVLPSCDVWDSSQDLLSSKRTLLPPRQSLRLAARWPHFFLIPISLIQVAFVQRSQR